MTNNMNKIQVGVAKDSKLVWVYFEQPQKTTDFIAQINEETLDHFFDLDTIGVKVTHPMRLQIQEQPSKLANVDSTTRTIRLSPIWHLDGDSASILINTSLVLSVARIPDNDELLKYAETQISKIKTLQNNSNVEETTNNLTSEEN